MMIARIMMSSGIPIGPSSASMVQPFLCSRWANSTILAICLLGSTTSGAKQFTSGVNVVEVYAAVTDAQGNPVNGLRKEDFTVLEDGQPQPLSAFTQGDF